MKVLQINSVNYGSTGNIMFGLSELIQDHGDQCLCATGFTRHKNRRRERIPVGGVLSKSYHMFAARRSGKHGCYSKAATRRLIAKIKSFSPDVIHLHNVHGWYLNIPILFAFLRESKIPVVWTLHDCWAFTGGCAQFRLCDCSRWQWGCGQCPQLGDYPIASAKERTAQMWQLKKELFQKMDNLTLVAPSQWLAELAKASFLREYPMQVIHNGIDLEAFRPVPSTVREKYGCTGKFLVLGVTMDWGPRKGLDVFCTLAQRLDTERFQILLVGTDERIERTLPSSIRTVRRTDTLKELAQLYSAADVYVNATREDTYPTVNMEALACGTPVITFNVGGSTEMLDSSCAVAVEAGNVEQLEKEIIRVCTQKPFSASDCLKKAEEFDRKKRFQEYIELYERVITRGNQAGGGSTA